MVYNDAELGVCALNGQLIPDGEKRYKLICNAPLEVKLYNFTTCKIELVH